MKKNVFKTPQRQKLNAQQQQQQRQQHKRRCMI